MIKNQATTWGPQGQCVNVTALYMYMMRNYQYGDYNAGIIVYHDVQLHYCMIAVHDYVT
jgi:hypothetical protein